MKIVITKKVGDTTLQFQVEEPKDVEALFQAGCISSVPTKCTACGSEEVEMTGNKKDGFTFVKVHCKKCGANSNMGQYKDGGFFWKAFEKYGEVKPSTAGNREITEEDLNAVFND